MTNPGPLVSVVVPTFNRGPVLRRTIASVLAQDLSDFELIVVDDGSTDTTPSVIESIEDRRVHYVRRKSNDGGAASRNTGIRAARGRYIAFLDSDDEWVPSKLSRQIDALRSADDRTVCYTQVIRSDGVGRSVSPARGKRSDEAVADYLFMHGGRMQTSTLALPRELAAETAFTEGLARHQDYDFCLRLEAAGAQFLFIDEPLTVWHAEFREDRVSMRPDPGPSLRWLDRSRSYMSARAESAFLARTVAPLAAWRGRRAYAVGRILQAVRTDSIDVPMALRLLGRVAVSPRWRNHVRRLAGWIGGRRRRAEGRPSRAISSTVRS